jgi:phosphatidylglycerophosphate synthase
MAEVNQQQVIDYIKGISVMELSQLVKELEKELGVSAAAAMANTAMQIVMLLLIMLGLLPMEFFSALARRLVDPYCFYILAVLGIASGLDYVFSWGSKAYREGKKRKHYKHGPASMRHPE